MENAALMAFIVIGAGVLIVWTIMTRKRQRATWMLVAETLGLEFIDDFFNASIMGRLDGLQVFVCTEARGTQNSRQEYTIIKVDIEDLPEGLSIEAEGIGAKVAKLFGSEDVQLGLAELDKRLMIKAQDAAKVRDWAQRENVAKALRKLSKLDTFRIRQGALTFERLGAVRDPDELMVLIRKVVSIAALLSPDTAPDSAITEQESGEAEEILW